MSAVSLITEEEALKRVREAYNRGHDDGVQKLTDSDGERIKALEVQYVHVMEQLTGMGKKVDDMHEILLQARGARWAIIGVAGLAGFISAKMAWLLTALGVKMP